ncbi:nitronate monooxygenase [Micromonospora profundi]|uniref:Propionate 3-nitronate monooxygenase n=1 Tax=Micromonospora profundi TaxID=1420889 RepID=A0AAJ6L218_9ACTN|nr:MULTISPECIES: nitronate monooxygenase [Micromonospora]KOX12276.1 2-nitropropane dioxygenase [Micromonospora sp. NRRL B-16802]WLS45225.1 nitronate monooxygenase [Micromonospora profundi]
MSVLSALRQPIVAAPMAGGPSTPALVSAVSAAGGLGFLAAGMIDTGRLVADIAEVRARTRRPFGVNVFLPGDDAVDESAIREYARRLAPQADQFGVSLGEPVGGDDAYPEKLAALLADPVPVVSFAFGLPDRAAVAALRERGTEVWATVTRPDAATAAAELGVDAVVVQGTEAGGHRGGVPDDDDYSLLPLLRLAAAVCDRPLVAAGGIADGPALAAALAAGAAAAQLGTVFLRCPEAGSSPLHRAAVASAAPTALTRAYTGKRARGVVNAFLRAHDAAAPAGYPQVLHLTRPLLAAARRDEDASVVNLWAGQAHPLARDVPAAQLVAEISASARAALATAAQLSTRWG